VGSQPGADALEHPAGVAVRASISDVSPVFVSTSAWFARGNVQTVKSRPGSATNGASRFAESRGGTTWSSAP
jgi:hypothetical protein